jgi:hypothetical protein
MIICDGLIFLQLQKCASTRIAQILRSELGGVRDRQHNRPDAARLDRPVLGSVRDPWSWYLSLWAFGCTGQGDLRHRVSLPPAPLRSFPGELRKSTAHGLTVGQALTAYRKDRRPKDPRWQSVYEDRENAEHFRTWLQLVLDVDQATVIDRSYGQSSLHRSAGLFTWRYLYLYSRDLAPLVAPGTAWTDVATFDAEQNVCARVIRTDPLEQNLIDALQDLGVDLSEAQTERIREEARVRKNTSKHQPLTHYYDERCVALVEARERFIIEKHGYEAPVVGSPG